MRIVFFNNFKIMEDRWIINYEQHTFAYNSLNIGIVIKFAPQVVNILEIKKFYYYKLNF